ncbi:MAG: (d)CMP kinase [Vicinamibacterales bacterium]
MKPSLIIAIDGPSGAGKGTLARALAARLNYRHVDTGAMYRAVAWRALQGGLSLDDDAAVRRLAEVAHLSVEGGRVTIDGHDVTSAIRTPEIDQAAAAVARLGGVREVLVGRQRRLGAAGGVVMEGRDIGTVVFPDADLKIYLDAQPHERARRRADDPAHTGGRIGLAGVQSDLEARDQTDATRVVGPLAVAPDAAYIDTTGLSVEATVDRVMQLVEQKVKEAV